MKLQPLAILSLLACAHAQSSVQPVPGFDLFMNTAYDSVRDRLVAHALDGTTWEVDGARIVPRVNLSRWAPGGRTAAAMAFDTSRRRVMFFGGQDSMLRSDTWSWDGTQWQLLPSWPPPTARHSAAMAFDSVRNRMIMFGGTGSAGALNDTWEHDGTTWLQRTVATLPSPSGRAKMTFDSGRGRCVMLASNSWAGDQASTWEWNGIDWTFRTFGSTTTPRNTAAIAYDPVRARTVAVGGSNEIWEWDGANWTLAATLTFALQHSCAAWFNPTAGATFVGGGEIATADRQDISVRSWNGTALVTLHREDLPSVRTACTLMPHFAGGALLFSGASPAPNSRFAVDTWHWTGQRWRRLQLATSPVPRSFAATTEQIATARQLMFGGSGQSMLSDFWAWDGLAWQQLPPGPPARQGAAMASDWVTGEVILFGGDAFGQPFGDMWVWNGASWSQRTTSGPSPRSLAAMVFDPFRNVTVLHGGIASTTPLTDTWEWNSRQWLQRAPALRPPPLRSPTLCFDWNRGRPALTGIADPTVAAGPFSEQLWEFTGTLWQFRSSRERSASPLQLQTVWDWSRGMLVSYDGETVREWTTVPASASVLDAGCGAPPPRLTLRARPRIGVESGLELFAGVQQSCVFALDTVTTSTPLGSGCTLHVGPAALLWSGITDASGFAELEMTIPADPLLRGITVVACAATRDTAAPAGFALTPGLSIRLGD